MLVWGNFYTIGICNLAEGGTDDGGEEEDINQLNFPGICRNC